MELKRSLVVERLTVQYGNVRAVDQLDIEVRAGQIVGLIGPNGAGKTSLIDALTGFTDSSGSILFMGAELAGRPAHERARRGLVRNWQSLELFDDLTVAENIMVSMHPRGLISRLGSGTRSRAHDDLARVLHECGLDAIAERLPSALSQGQRKSVSLARALASNPLMILADEPAAGLDTVESAALGHRLRHIAGGGPGILLVDHDMGLVLDVCSYVYVIDFGRLIAQGRPSEIRHDERVISAYLGQQGGDEAEPEALSSSSLEGSP